MAQESPIAQIPLFRPDGYLPEGVHVCSEAEVLFRFGSLGRRRRRLVRRLRRWLELGRQVGARRLLVDGSFVTARRSRAILTRLFCFRKISLSSLSASMNQRWNWKRCC
jgi:hypothetical protein